MKPLLEAVSERSVSQDARLGAVGCQCDQPGGAGICVPAVFIGPEQSASRRGSDRCRPPVARRPGYIRCASRVLAQRTERKPVIGGEIAIAVLAVSPERTPLHLILVLSISSWIIYARVVRGVTLSIREREFVQAARAIGVTDMGIMWRHILPNLAGWNLMIQQIAGRLEPAPLRRGPLSPPAVARDRGTRHSA